MGGCAIIVPVIFYPVRKVLYAFVLCALFLTACSGSEPTVVEETPTPAPTEGPMAVRVNGEGILLSEYENEMRRVKAGMALADAEFDEQLARELVLDELIEQTLLAQSAFTNGYSQSDAEIDGKIEEYEQELGGAEALDTYLSDFFYTRESFRSAVARDQAAIFMRNLIIDAVPLTAEQIRARQIVLDTENEAIGVLRQLEVGTPFRDLAFEYDPLAGGELGWFPRGYLYQPAVEEAAFSLQPGQFSGIIPTDFGFHIVEVMERSSDQPLAHDAKLFVQRNALEDWLTSARDAAELEILVP